MVWVLKIQGFLETLELKSSYQHRLFVVCFMCCFVLIACSDDDPRPTPQPKPKVVGLSNDTTPKPSKTWTWNCQNNDSTCKFRFTINKSNSHTFGDSDLFDSKKIASKTITKSSDDGTYYIHVQAENANGRSDIAKASAVLKFTATPPLEVSGLPTTPDTTPKPSKTWTWGCKNNSGTCTYRHAVNTNASHTFASADTFNSDTTTTKTLTASSQDDTYYLHVQAKDSNGFSKIARTSAVLKFTAAPSLEVSGLPTTPDTTPKSSKTWTWGCKNNSGTCSYRHVTNTDATYTFTSVDTFNSETTETKTLTASSEDGTYYLHVQAKDSNGLSEIARTSAVLKFTAAPSLEVSGLPTTPDTTPKISKTWTWGCKNNSGTCTYRYVVNTHPTYTFTNADIFNSDTTTTKTLTDSSEDGTYYLHVQAKDDTGESQVAKTSAILKYMPPLTLKSPTPHRNSLQLYTELRPIFDVNGISSGKRVALYEGSSCQKKLSDDGTVINGKAELKPLQNLHYRTYSIYLGVRDSQSATTIDCKSEGVKYIAYRPLALSNDLSCYLFNHGRVVCWGKNNYGQLGQDGPGSAKNIGKVATEDSSDRPMSTLKGNFINLGTNRLAKAIVTGTEYACALLDNDAVKCWGVNNHGQLGQGDTTAHIGSGDDDMARLQSIDLGTGRTAKFITAGYAHTCALLDNDTVKCWGYNKHGQLGQNNTTQIGSGSNQMGDQLTAIDFGCRTNTDPCPAKDQLKPLLIASGFGHSCALFQDQVSMKCWGWNDNGQLGQNNRTRVRSTNYNIGDHSSRSLAKAPLINLGLGTNQKVQNIFAGGDISCILSSDDRLKCWGNNHSGQLGQNDTELHGSESNGGSAGQPGQNGICNGTGNDAKVDNEICTVAGLPFIDLGNTSATTKYKVKNASVAMSSVCVLLDTDQIKCFGENGHGELGQNDTINHGSASNGGGSNTGQNGICNGTGNDAKVDNEVCTVAGLAPVELGCHTLETPCPTNRNFKARNIVTGGEYACATLKTAKHEDLTDIAKCWGWNVDGQLGQDDTQQRGHNTTYSVDGIPAINLASFRICSLDKPYPDYSAVNNQCLPSCGTACNTVSGGGECQSGNACDDTTNYTITRLTSYDQSKCCVRVRK